MFLDKTIRTKVMAVINSRIAEAQKVYDKGCAILDKNLVKDKATLADKQVDEILGNFDK